MTLLLTFQTGPGVHPVGIKGSFTRVKRRGSAHSNVVSRSRMGGAMPTLVHAPSLRGQGQLSLLVYTMNWVWGFGKEQPLTAAATATATAQHTTCSRSAAQHSVEHLQKTDRHFSFLMLPECGKNIAFVKVPKLRQFVLITKATCSWRWVWSVGGMVLTGETDVLAEKPVPVPLGPS